MTNENPWTIMIYMVGDNNLSADLSYALDELRQWVSNHSQANIDIFIYYKNNSPEIPNLYCDISQNYFEPENLTNSSSSAEGGGNSRLPVAEFVDWGLNRLTINRPENVTAEGSARRFGLIFAGHSMGFLSSGLLSNNSASSSMTLKDLGSSLRVIKENRLKRKIDILGFDSCVMGMLEIGEEFKSVARTMIASEGTIPNAGWSYSDILNCLRNDSSGLESAVSKIVKGYISRQSRYAIGGVSVDMSAWNLERMDNINQRLEEFSKVLLKCFQNESSQIYKQMELTLLKVHYDCQTFMNEQCIDLGDFCSLLLGELDRSPYSAVAESAIISKLRNSAVEILEEIPKSIILSGFSGGSFQYATGISLFLPWSINAYKICQRDYQSLDFTSSSNGGRLWNRFLQVYLGKVTRRKNSGNQYHSLEGSGLPIL